MHRGLSAGVISPAGAGPGPARGSSGWWVLEPQGMRKYEVTMLKLILRCCEKDVPKNASKPILLQELLRHVFPDSDDVTGRF